MSQRVSIEVPGLGHDNPIPAACRKGPFLVSSTIAGKDQATGKVVEGIEAQCAHMFANLRAILKEAGAVPEDIVKFTVWLKDRGNRPYVNKHWVELFPDPHSRPARHTFAAPDLAEPMLVQCEIMAFIE
jgi:2-iminobutanoate/2-iminopropanoate deaminase